MNRIRLPRPHRIAAILLVLLLPACTRSPDHSHDAAGGHTHEDKTAQITVWTDRYEIFAEHLLVAAGVETKFITHVTDLQTQEPRREGPIKFRLSLGHDAPIDVVADAPSRAGIYETALTFPTKGDWNVSVLIPTNGGEAVVTLPPVKVYGSKHAAQHGDPPAAPEGVSFLKEQQWKILSKAEPMTKRRLVERVRVPAMVTARPGALAKVTTPIAGRVLPPPGRSLPMVGDRVEKGQTLALLQPSFSELAVRFAEAEAEVVRAKLEVEQAELSYKRTEKLAAAEAKSARELQEAGFALKSAQARHAAAIALQATYRQSSAVQPAGAAAPPAVELKSPIAGIITDDRRTPDGEHVAADLALFTVLDHSTVFIEAKVPEAALARLGEAKRASYESPGNPGQFTSITDGQGRLVFTGLQVDPVTRTVPLIYEAKNNEGSLRIGQLLTLHVETARAEDAVAIPDSAIVEEGDQPVAFVQVSGETFQKRELKLGIRDSGFVQVLDGLKEGDRVVTKGAYAIRLSSISGVIPAHGHAH